MDVMRADGWVAIFLRRLVLPNALQHAMSVALVSPTQDAAVVAEYATTTMQMCFVCSIRALEARFNGQPTNSY